MEALFDREDAPLPGEAYAEWMRKHGLIRWVNAIVYDHRAVLAAGHNDDISAPGRMDEGWGWLLDHGFNIIQTDWPMMLRHYIWSSESNTPVHASFWQRRHVAAFLYQAKRLCRCAAKRTECVIECKKMCIVSEKRIRYI